MTDEEEWDSGLEPPEHPTFYETENPVVGVILGPGGERLSEMRERLTVSFGMRRRPKTPSRVRRIGC